MVQLLDYKHDLWLRGMLRPIAWTILTHFPLLLRFHLFDFLFPWLPLIIGISINLILRMFFFTAIFMRRCIWSNL